MVDSKNWEVVIGLEVHIQLLLQAKIFSPSATKFGAPPNTQADIIDLAMPGVLPVLNEGAARMAVMFGLAVNGEIAPRSVFERKNYFYPDLPKGYQISQYQTPIVSNGKLAILLPDARTKTISITRAHLEEDAGKSLHEDFAGSTGIDLNRAGVALLEIVSAPELQSALEAVAYLKTLHTLVCTLGICDGNMQEGSFRCDVNLSLNRPGAPMGTRCEIKNINSFRFVEKAIQYEISRQTEELDADRPIRQETRLFDADTNTTRPMRAKEEANDYRYFPDPDLLPVAISQEYIAAIAKDLPELPGDKMQRFQRDYQLPLYEANLLTASSALANYYEQAVQVVPTQPKLVANWMVGELAAFMNKHNLEITQVPIPAPSLGQLILRIADNSISSKTAKDIFILLWEQGGSVDAIISAQNLTQVSDEATILKVIDAVLQAHPQEVADYKAGRTKVMGFLVGQVMKALGKANPAKVNALLQQKLG